MHVNRLIGKACVRGEEIRWTLIVSDIRVDQSQQEQFVKPGVK